MTLDFEVRKSQFSHRDDSFKMKTWMDGVTVTGLRPPLRSLIYNETQLAMQDITRIVLSILLSLLHRPLFL